MSARISSTVTRQRFALPFESSIASCSRVSALGFIWGSSGMFGIFQNLAKSRQNWLDVGRKSWLTCDWPMGFPARTRKKDQTMTNEGQEGDEFDARAQRTLKALE